MKLPAPPGLEGQALARWRVLKPDTVTIERDGKPVTLAGEALVRWKYQRYMQDYLATVQSVDGSVGQVLDYLVEKDVHTQVELNGFMREYYAQRAGVKTKG